MHLPATLAIDKQGIVTYAFFVDADYTKRAEPEEILKAIPQEEEEEEVDI